MEINTLAYENGCKVKIKEAGEDYEIKTSSIWRPFKGTTGQCSFFALLNIQSGLVVRLEEMKQIKPTEQGKKQKNFTLRVYSLHNSSDWLDDSDGSLTTVTTFFKAVVAIRQIVY